MIWSPDAALLFIFKPQMVCDLCQINSQINAQKIMTAWRLGSGFFFFYQSFKKVLKNSKKSVYFVKHKENSTFLSFYSRLWKYLRLA